MSDSDTTPLLEAEIESFGLLEQKIDQLLERLEEIKREREQAAQQRDEIEGLLRRREDEIAQLKQQLGEAQTRTIKPETETVIRKKLSGLLEKLESY